MSAFSAFCYMESPQTLFFAGWQGPSAFSAFSPVSGEFENPTDRLYYDRPYSIAGEIRVLRFHFSEPSKSRDQDFSIADVFCFCALSIALQMSSFTVFPNFDLNFFSASKPLKKPIDIATPSIRTYAISIAPGIENTNRDRSPICSRKTEIRLVRRPAS